MTRSALVSAGSPDPAAKSSTTESGEIAAADSSASVIAVFQRAEHSAHRPLTRARAAASHELRSFISLHSFVLNWEFRPQTTPAVTGKKPRPIEPRSPRTIP